MEKKDQLEEFIAANRDEFDSHLPSPSVWEGIKTEVDAEKESKPILVPLRKAIAYGSAAVIIVAFGLVYFLSQEPKIQVADTLEKVGNLDGYSLSDVSPELAEVEGYYMTKVNQKMEKLETLDVDPELLEEINFLDEEFHSLQVEMGESVNNDQIIEAMIDNYRLKLEILEAMLLEFESVPRDEEWINNIEKDEVDNIII
ncbi:MAG: hypothetical protein JKY54_08920 [Flavobacteriales bacterium]|nr:hypothetical protein [Flavobacteriales bacterium]